MLQNSTKYTAFVIGNGTSRKNIPLQKLKNLGSLYGCNGLYREMELDVLVATDRGMASEIEDSGYPKNNKFYTRKPNEKTGSLLIPNQWKGWSSGPVSLALALNNGHQKIFLIGHDFGSTDDIFNNCYAGTQNYRKVGSPATYSGNWINQIKILLTTHANAKIVRVVGKESARAEKLKSIPNYSEMETETFCASINI